MQLKFVDVGIAAEMLGHDWTVAKIVQKINEGELTAYARICFPLDQDDSDEVYEIVRIKSLSEMSIGRHLKRDICYRILYETIELPENNSINGEVDDDNYNILEATDIYIDPLKGRKIERVFGHLKSRSILTEFVSAQEICILSSDILQTMTGGKGFEVNAGQILAEKRHNTKERDLIVQKIMQKITALSKEAPKDCIVINHRRFIKEADVPEKLVKSVSESVCSRIKTDSNGFFKPLSRAPKKKETEPYFLPK